MKTTLSSEEGLSPQKMSNNLISAAEQGEGNSKPASKAISESTVQLNCGLQLVHATPGRVRLRATDSSLKLILDTISQELRQQDGVREVSTNQQTGSLAIAFDEKKLSLPQILEVLQQFGVSEPQASLPEEQKTDPFAAWKSVEFWKEQGLDIIPLITGLMVTGGLGIHGLPAIPVYLIAAGATRQVIDKTISEEHKAAEEGEKVKGERLKEESLFPLPLNPSPTSEIAYSVVHAIPGRVRFSVPRIAQDRAYARRLEKLVKADAQVTSVRVNPNAASIAITYEAGVIPVSHWVDLIHSADEERAQTIVTTATTQQASSEENSEADIPITLIAATQQTTPRAASLWTELKPPALAAYLAFMAHLPVQALLE
jgi:hypothetical protein